MAINCNKISIGMDNESDGTSNFIMGKFVKTSNSNNNIIFGNDISFNNCDNLLTLSTNKLQEETTSIINCEKSIILANNSNISNQSILGKCFYLGDTITSRDSKCSFVIGKNVNISDVSNNIIFGISCESLASDTLMFGRNNKLKNMDNGNNGDNIIIGNECIVKGNGNNLFGNQITYSDDSTIATKSTFIGYGIELTNNISKCLLIGNDIKNVESVSQSLLISFSDSNDSLFVDTNNSFLIGNSNKIKNTNDTFIFGNNSKIEDPSLNNLKHSYVLGSNCIIKSNNSYAIGISCEINQDTSFAIGRDIISNGMYSIAMGFGVEISGDSSISIGKESKAQGSHNLAIGCDSRTTGTYSSVIGYNSKSVKNGFTIGNNINNNQTDVMLIGGRNKNVSDTGYDEINKIIFTTGARDPSNELITVDIKSRDIDCRELTCQSFNTDNILNTSDERIKSNITNISSRESLDHLLNITPKKYSKNILKKHDTVEEAGLIAQEVKNLFPDLVTEKNENIPINTEYYKFENNNDNSEIYIPNIEFYNLNNECKVNVLENNQAKSISISHIIENTLYLKEKLNLKNIKLVGFKVNNFNYLNYVKLIPYMISSIHELNKIILKQQKQIETFINNNIN